MVKFKRRWSSPANSENAKHGFRGWSERGYLPHRDEPGLLQFVTFHLADSFPESLRSEWEHFAKLEDHHEKRKQTEAYLDKGRGECHLRSPNIAELVETNFRSFARNPSCDSHIHPPDSPPSAMRYDLRAWVIMPNHVHILFRTGSVSMSETVGAWKKHTGRLANRLLGNQGAFWEEDYFDTFIRDSEHERNTIHYIENNPVKAKLVRDPRAWLWSSARFRDQFGRLTL